MYLEMVCSAIGCCYYVVYPWFVHGDGSVVAPGTALSPHGRAKGTYTYTDDPLSAYGGVLRPSTGWEIRGNGTFYYNLVHFVSLAGRRSLGGEAKERWTPGEWDDPSEKTPWVRQTLGTLSGTKECSRWSSEKASYVEICEPFVAVGGTSSPPSPPSVHLTPWLAWEMTGTVGGA